MVSNRLIIYNWQQPDWVNFQYELAEVEEMLFAFAEETGHISGVLKALPRPIQNEAIIDMMVAEAIKTSEIEGEHLSRRDVMSSIRNNLGLNKTPDLVKDKMSQGAGELMVNVRQSFAEPLTEQKLFAWHKMLFKQSRKKNVGVWRTHKEAMQVISGAIGKEKIHFEAPPSSRVQTEMKKYIHWFNETAPGGRGAIKKAPVRSAIAHLYFESIHPFEDGNGRIGRAIAEKALSQTLGRPVLLSLSRTIEADKNAYYKALQQAQRSNDVTGWIIYFVKLALDAQRQANLLINHILKKSQFFDHYKDVLNERQLKVIRRIFDAGPDGFEGGMNANKYASITKTSKATATRDLQYLLEQKALVMKGGGRSTHYFLNT
ncbi:MAG: Fic family protein [Ginsengibacter sp.]